MDTKLYACAAGEGAAAIFMSYHLRVITFETDCCLGRMLRCVV